MYIELFGKKQAGKDVPKMSRRINQWFLKSDAGVMPPDRLLQHIHTKEILL